jgi:hypothetical protein
MFSIARIFEALARHNASAIAGGSMSRRITRR